MAIDDLDYSAARRLICAVSAVAIKDARKGDADAAAWLLGESAAWLEMIGFSHINEADLRDAIADTTPIRYAGWG